MAKGPPTFDLSQRTLATKSIEDIDTELAMLTDYAFALRTHRNSLVAISKLPSEILAAIFQACADASHGEQRHSSFHMCSSPCLSWISITHVCQFWRSVALEHPTLWCQLPCFHLRWTEEFLARAKSAPLIIRAAASASVPRGPSRSVKSALAHIAQTRELTLTVPSKELLEQLLDSVHTAAPMLESLLLKSSHSGFHVANYAYHVPAQLFLGITPRLRRLGLYKCNVDWNSPLLTNLTHLSISDITPAIRPSIDALAETLSRMPALEDLTLEDFLMQASPRTSPPPNHTQTSPIPVELSRLSRLHIRGSVTDASSVFSILRLTRPLERLGLHCKYVGTPKQDFAALRPIIAALNRDTHPTGCSTSPPSPQQYSHSPSRLFFGSTSQRCSRFVYTSWSASGADSDPGSDSDPPAHFAPACFPAALALTEDRAILQISYESLRETANQLITEAADALDLGAVTEAEFCGNTLPSPCYERLLARMTSLETLRASHLDVDLLTAPLLPRATDPVLDDEDDSSNSSNSSNGNTVIAAPALRKLSLSRVFFGAEAGLNIGDMPALAACIAQRRQHNSLLDKLELRKCWNFALYDWASLKGLVVDLDWDHIERWEDEATITSDSSTG